MKKFKVGFIGAGNIASAIFFGIIDSGYIKPENICVFDTNSDKIDYFVSNGAVALNDAVSVADKCEFVFLTIKPQIYEIVLKEISSINTNNTCFVDVAAGISIDFVKRFLGDDTPVVRVMPNTPLMYGVGASALVKVSPVTDAQFEFVKGCFDSCGVTVVVEEQHINTVTAISGSAPAYVMRVMKDFIDFAVQNGMDFDDAKTLVLQVFAGSSKMVNCDDRKIDDLIKAVTSPNGTTEAGLKSLDTDCFDDLVYRCLDATTKRADELSK